MRYRVYEDCSCGGFCEDYEAKDISDLKDILDKEGWHPDCDLFDYYAIPIPDDVEDIDDYITYEIPEHIAEHILIRKKREGDSGTVGYWAPGWQPF